MPLSREDWVNIANTWDAAEKQIATDWNSQFKFGPRPPAPDEVFRYFSLRLDNLQGVMIMMLRQLIETSEPKTIVPLNGSDHAGE